MATADEERQAQPATYKEAEKLLEMAERLEKDCLEQERLISRWWMIGSTIVAVFISFIFCAWAIETFGNTMKIVMVSTVIVYSTIMGWYFLQMLRKRTRQLHKDQRALFELLNMLRDIEEAVAERNNVSAIERAEFRIRLSRFDIGPEYYYAQRGRRW
jgi:hypothetical protein